MTWAKGTWCNFGCKGDSTVLVQLLQLKNYLWQNQLEQANVRDPCSRPQVTKDQNRDFAAGKTEIRPLARTSVLTPSVVSVAFSTRTIRSWPALQWELNSFLIIKWKASTHAQPAEHAASTLLAPHCKTSHTLGFQLEAFVCSPRSLGVMCARARNTPLSFFLILLTHPELLWR